MKRRQVLALFGVGAIAAAGYRYWPDQGWRNPCRPASLPATLAKHELVQQALAGIDPAQLWDCHSHLIGVGDSDSGIWINPQMLSLRHPIQYAQRRFYMNASCAEKPGTIDRQFVDRLLVLRRDLPPASRTMLLAFDYHYNRQGERLKQYSSYYTPNSYAARLTSRYRQHFEWIASIHPYRRDAISALHRAKRMGARAIKWLPPAMGMDPASPLCDRFYQTLAKLKLPLLTHAGDELAVHGKDAQALGNPLHLRRPLDHGVRVIVTHCASLGSNVDTDKGRHGPRVRNFDLFLRLLQDQSYRGRLYGEISALTQFNRVGDELDTLIKRQELHAYLINGSDYPLPGVMPLFSMRQLIGRGYISRQQAKVLSQIRQYNPMLFDFVLKRQLKVGDRQFQPSVFHSRRAFEFHANKTG